MVANRLKEDKRENVLNGKWIEFMRYPSFKQYDTRAYVHLPFGEGGIWNTGTFSDFERILNSSWGVALLKSNISSQIFQDRLRNFGNQASAKEYLDDITAMLESIFQTRDSQYRILSNNSHAFAAKIELSGKIFPLVGEASAVYRRGHSGAHAVALTVSASELAGGLLDKDGELLFSEAIATMVGLNVNFHLIFCKNGFACLWRQSVASRTYRYYMWPLLELAPFSDNIDKLQTLTQAIACVSVWPKAGRDPPSFEIQEASWFAVTGTPGKKVVLGCVPTKQLGQHNRDQLFRTPKHP